MIKIEGKIKPGKQQGRRLGFPTINIVIPKQIKSEQWGIYFSLVRINDRVYPGITHLGPVKTFSLGRKTCETHLLVASQDWYGQQVTKRLLFKFRDIEKFPNIKLLRKQIRRDVKAAKKFFGL
ncbi:MAG: riboflavin kinase [Patescibacteria group bacterium]|jgi:riboflavin kinase/FMN adenylyltransferase|nr:riboflavin kinase [Patescibacteria group bacterium]